MILESYYTDADKTAFLAKVKTICADLAIDPNWLMLVMFKEARLNPRAYNASSQATGLIQFLPSTAVGLGTTVDAIRGMSGVEQLDWVKKYLAPYKGRYKSFVDVYLAVFYPKALGKGDMYVIAVKGSRVYDLNKSMDRNPDNGKLSVLDVKWWLKKGLPSDAAAYLDELEKKKQFH